MPDRSPTCPGPLDFRPAVTRMGSRRGGHARAALYAHVIDGKRYSTRQVAERLGVHYDTARERIKRAQHPLTWAALEAGNR
ncbi:hypothetical protein [[Pseudomonas] boreopolis]|uniref:Uncharacterized protein n=1 Tax=Xanthomonas boreopolis TaxID=86183 RepID=A0A919F7G5_9XANT|nr:hypothetical protein GCM10009090_17650 [[Pseudomonas] boreopolis]